MTTDIAETSLQAATPLNTLKRVPDGQNNTAQFLLTGNSSAITSLLVIWFPVFAVLCYGFVVPFTFTAWGENNLLLILAIWSAAWLMLTLVTLIAGTGRHMYNVDLAQRTITHLNSGQTTSLALELRQRAEGDALELKEPLDSGWHLEADTRTVSELEPEEANDIPEWQPLSLKEHFTTKAKDGSLMALFVFINIPLAIIHFVSSTGGLFFACQLYLLAAWAISQTVSWLLERRDYRLNA
ncbi:hypothetical protein ACJO5Y_17755 [Marinobacter sp. GN3S48]|uniref:hypothetical protein n=1 Tax=Marinobacter sp. GN3S48 TaxID=3382302 RepID=UPI00387B3CB6